MEKTDHLFPVFSAALEAKQKLDADTATAAAQARTAAAGETAYEETLKTMRDCVEAHPELSDLQKAAWMAAINLNDETPDQIEHTASRLTELLDKLNAVFGEEDVPVFEYERARSSHNLVGVKTTGSGLITGSAFDIHAIVAAQHYPEGRKDRIDMRGLNGVFTTAEEVKQTFSLGPLDESPEKVLPEKFFIAGQEAILSFTETMYGMDKSRGYGNSLDEQLYFLALDIGIDLYKESEVVRQDLESAARRRAERAARKPVEYAFNGYDDFNFRDILNVAEKEGVPIELLIEEIEKRHDAGVAHAAAWLEGLKNALVQHQQPNQESASSK